jgi:hypothetical protein
MNRQETAQVLAKCAAFDQRTVGGADVIAWHEVIGRLDFGDALGAVTRHYSETNHRAMPADILAHGRRIRDERTRSPHEIRALPSRFETDEERAERTARGLATVGSVLQPIIARLEAVRDEIAATPADERRQRAIKRAREERKGKRR